MKPDMQAQLGFLPLGGGLIPPEAFPGEIAPPRFLC